MPDPSPITLCFVSGRTILVGAPEGQLRALRGSQIAADQLSSFSQYTNFTTR
jgi:hypothetical protein